MKTNISIVLIVFLLIYALFPVWCFTGCKGSPVIANPEQIPVFSSTGSTIIPDTLETDIYRSTTPLGSYLAFFDANDSKETLSMIRDALETSSYKEAKPEQAENYWETYIFAKWQAGSECQPIEAVKIVPYPNREAEDVPTVEFAIMLIDCEGNRFTIVLSDPDDTLGTEAVYCNVQQIFFRYKYE